MPTPKPDRRQPVNEATTKPHINETVAEQNQRLQYYAAYIDATFQVNRSHVGLAVDPVEVAYFALRNLLKSEADRLKLSLTDPTADNWSHDQTQSNAVARVLFSPMTEQLGPHFVKDLDTAVAENRNFSYVAILANALTLHPTPQRVEQIPVENRSAIFYNRILDNVKGKLVPPPLAVIKESSAALNKLK